MRGGGAGSVGDRGGMGGEGEDRSRSHRCYLKEMQSLHRGALLGAVTDCSLLSRFQLHTARCLPAGRPGSTGYPCRPPSGC